MKFCRLCHFNYFNAKPNFFAFQKRLLTIGIVGISSRCTLHRSGVAVFGGVCYLCISSSSCGVITDLFVNITVNSTIFQFIVYLFLGNLKCVPKFYISFSIIFKCLIDCLCKRYWTCGWWFCLALHAPYRAFQFQLLSKILNCHAAIGSRLIFLAVDRWTTDVSCLRTPNFVQVNIPKSITKWKIENVWKLNHTHGAAFAKLEPAFKSVQSNCTMVRIDRRQKREN